MKNIINKTKEFLNKPETKEKINNAKTKTIEISKKSKEKFDEICDKADVYLKNKIEEKKTQKEDNKNFENSEESDNKKENSDKDIDNNESTTKDNK